MYKLCKTEESAKRQKEIEMGLFDQLKIMRYEDITVTALCERMNMPRKAFYRYFDSKDDALAALIDHTMSDYSGFSGDFIDSKRRSLILELEEYFKFWYEKRSLLIALDRSGLVGTLMDRVINYPINDRIAVIKFLPDEDERMREKVFHFALCGLVYMMIEWYRDSFKTSISDMAKAACRMFNTPLFPNLETLGFDL